MLLLLSAQNGADKNTTSPMPKNQCNPLLTRSVFKLFPSQLLSEGFLELVRLSGFVFQAGKVVYVASPQSRW